MKKVTVLLTAAGTPVVPGLAACLRHNGEREIRLIGTDMQDDPTISQLFDKVYYAPAATAPDYAATLLEICRKEKVDIIIPGISKELPVLREHFEEFKRIGTTPSVTRGEGLLIANDKIRLYQYMRDHGYDMPGFTTIHSLGEFEDACRQIGYPEKPICVKMRDGSGSRGIRIINPKVSRYEIFANEKPNSFFTTYKDLLSILQEAPELPELMVMEYLPGREYSVDVLADNGEVKYILGRDSNVVLASIPQEATLSRNEEAYAISERIVRDLRLDGNIDLDFKFDAQGHPRLMEINPRIAATLSVFCAGGVNLLYLRVKQLLGEELPELKPRYGVKLKRRYYDFFCDKDGNAITI